MPSPVTIDETRCAGCTQCRLVCPAHAIEQPASRCRVQADRCTGCGTCRWVCPVGCISNGINRQGTKGGK